MPGDIFKGLASLGDLYYILCANPGSLGSTCTVIFAPSVPPPPPPPIHQCIFGQSIIRSVFKCMSKRLIVIYIFGKFADVQSLTFFATGEGENLSRENFPNPHVRWRKFVSMPLRRDTCWRCVLIAECRTKGKVKGEEIIALGRTALIYSTVFISVAGVPLHCLLSKTKKTAGGIFLVSFDQRCKFTGETRAWRKKTSESGERTFRFCLGERWPRTADALMFMATKHCLRFFKSGSLEVILVSFGRRALIFFLFESSWKYMKSDTTFVRMRSDDHLGDAKMSKKGTSLRPNQLFLFIAIDKNGFRRMKVEGHISEPQIF